MNFINTTYPRPSAELVAKFKGIPTPILSDVMGRNSCMDHRIKPVYRYARSVGPALTVRAYPSDNLMVHVALKLAQPGDLLVVDAGGYPNAGLWGEMMSIAAQLKLITGIVIDGGVRDCHEIEEMNFPVFSAGINARGGYKSDPGAVGCTISCGGIPVNPGDIVVADENGVVVIPPDKAPEIYSKAQQKIKSEEWLIQQMKQGKELFELLGLEKELKKLGFLGTIG